ncbi:MAG TPA: lysophospholipid acyltransferase family protein [Solirubrobacteraceae bacterium]|nr:lysophospholipid acyltransferase family protein [Solirubrobacteraceae bacterium]
MPDVQIREQRYKDERPAEYFARYHERTRTREPEAHVYEVVRALTVLNALITFRARSIGSENVPAGPVILAPNHASFMDHFFSAGFIRRRVQFMAKSQLFAPGPAQYIFSHGGVFPVRRGVADEEAFTTAFAVLARGGALGMYCEGGRSRTGELAASARPGIGRLALQSGAPVVPVAILGSHQARNWRRGRLPKVIVRYGAPFRFEIDPAPSRERQQECADAILERIRVLHSEMVALGARGTLRAARRGELRG